MDALPSRIGWSRRAPLLGYLLVVGLVMAGPARADRVVYSHDFQGPLGMSFSEWSALPIVCIDTSKTPTVTRTLPAPPITNADTPNKEKRFLGPFGGPVVDPPGPWTEEHTVRLSLKDLPPHAKVTVAFDLYILQSWDGNSPGVGPDRWSLAVVDGPTLLDTTFSNILTKNGRSYTSLQDYPKPGSHPQAGASATNSFGYKYFGDSTYRLTYTFPHTADALALDFRSKLFEGRGLENESWGLDNIAVKVDAAAAVATKGTLPGYGSRAFTPVVQGPDTGQFELVGLESSAIFIRDGEVRLSGKPQGYFATRGDFKDYVLQFEWQFERPSGFKPGAKFEGESGLLLHVEGPPKVWPKAIEVHLRQTAESANVSPLDEAQFSPQKDDHAILGRLLKPVGQWNRAEVTSRGGTITVKVNGVEVARGAGAEPDHGAIGWMSDGVPIRFRNMKIKRLD